MSKRPLALAAALLCLAGPAAHAQELPRQVLDTTRATAVMEARPEYTALPLTVEIWVRLDNRLAYNIIVANENKPSATHWELFTTPNDGRFSVYTPGRNPNHTHSLTDIVDGQWHFLVVVMEPDRVRLFVDGAEKANQASPAPAQPGLAAPMVVGALVDGALGCVGQIDELRLSHRSRDGGLVPRVPLAADADTVGLWDFNKARDGRYPDRSALANHAQVKANTSTIFTAEGPIAGGMPTAFQPMPPPEDAAPLRAALQSAAKALGLTSLGPIRDDVLRAWSRDFVWMGREEYPESRGTGNDLALIKDQVCDRHALLWPEDGGALGTVLRRTGALLEKLRQLGAAGALKAPAADLAKLEQAKPGDPASAGYKTLYLAACAVRRQIAFTNPLLNFDRLLFTAHGSFAGSVRSNPATQDYQGGHFVTQYFGFNALPGGGLFVLQNFKTKPRVVNVLANSVVRNGRLQGQKLDHGAFTSPDLSYDGRTIVFAWTGNREHRWTYSKDTCWHLFRVNVDGSNLVQLTDGPFDDITPCWLPNGRIAFSSERRGGYIRCFAASLKVRNYTLFSMKLDGSDITPLSYYETSEWHPSVNNEGQLVYTRWDYTDRENCLGTRFWISGPDGADPRAPHGNYPLPWNTFPDHKPWAVRPDGRETDSRLGAPLVEMGIRAIPNSHQYIFTAAPHHGEIFGSLCLLDLRREDDGHMSQVRRLTPDEAFPETEVANRRHYRFGTPWPLSEDFVLCNEWENLVLLDRFGNKELLGELPLLPVAQDERLRMIFPIPLRPRPVPPIIPPRAQTSANAKADHPRATISVMNVNDSDQPFPPGTKIRWLRVTQNILKENHAMGEPMIGYERENTPRIPLGIVPVEADGSAYFEGPVAKGLIFQALDENYMAVQSMRSTAFVHPGEQLSCAGCHQPYEKAPRVKRAPLAMRRPPSRLQPEIGPVEPISYYRQIKPIFDKTCVACHQQRGRGPTDMSYAALKEGYTFWFSGAMWTDMASAYSGVHGGSRTIPGRFGARASRIGQALLTPVHQQAVSPEDRHKIIVWLDSNSPRLTAFTREAAQLRGELVWPVLDVDPLNVQGVEGRGRALKDNFWHENQYGPYAFLCAEHAHDRLVIMDAQGTIRWEYSVPHPQDVWMLPNGNILTSYTHGVREVTRDKQIVWEYKTQAPNEIPNCQPLPDGNVLIGIVGECRLIEVNRRGQIVRQVQLSTPVKEPHAQFRMCRKTPEGTYLVPFTAEGAVREYDAAGQVLRSFPDKPSPVCALRLEDDHTLI
ncbi:MAG: LamG-like jellyroll fold domain-containing protein, partial [Armatimonadota bacterium]